MRLCHSSRATAQLPAGQVRTEAAVRTGAEGDVAVGLAVEDHLVGVGEPAGSRFADESGRNTMSPVFIGQPWNSTSCSDLAGRRHEE